MVKNDSFFLWTDAQSWHNTEKFFEDTKKRTESEKQLSGKRKDEKMEEVMILADKIINLRKKNGWSQEELAEKLGVTRQSISKYEGAQSIPDLDKILNDPSNYIESSKYFSWERFFTHLATKYSDSRYKYDKDNLDVYYMSNYNMKKVKPLLPKELQKLSVIGNDKSLNPLSLF